jgi:hypothetical protein
MSFTPAGQVIGLFIIGLGLLNIIARDFFWKTEECRPRRGFERGTRRWGRRLEPFRNRAVEEKYKRYAIRDLHFQEEEK